MAGPNPILCGAGPLGRSRNFQKERHEMGTILIVVLLVLLLGGGGFWYRGRRRA